MIVLSIKVCLPHLVPGMRFILLFVALPVPISFICFIILFHWKTFAHLVNLPGMSLIYTRNISGANTEPCVIPLVNLLCRQPIFYDSHHLFFHQIVLYLTRHLLLHFHSNLSVSKEVSCVALRPKSFLLKDTGRSRFM